MQKIIDLARQYSDSFKYCFHKESSIRWIERFAAARFENTLTIEITEEERNNNDLKQIFVDEFTKATLERIAVMNTIVDETGKKKTLVKRKKD